MEASVKRGFEAGVALERDLFFELFVTPESKALRHMFFAERAGQRLPISLPRRLDSSSKRSP